MGLKKAFSMEKALNSKLGKTRKFLIKSLFNRFFANPFSEQESSNEI